MLKGLWRITASFKFANGFSAWLLAISFPFLSLAFLYKRNPRIRKAVSVLAALLIYCLYYTYTRGASLSFIFVLFLMLLIIGGRAYYITFFSLLFVLGALMLVLPENLKNTIGLSKIVSYGSSGTHRLAMWQTAWRMFVDRPFLGQGLNTFMANYERFKAPHGVDGIWYAHNCYLQIAAETGIIGILSFLWMGAKMVIVSLKSWRDINDEFLRYLYLGLFCGIVAFLIHMSVEVSLYSLQLAVLFYVLLGLLMAIKNIGLRHGKI